MKCSQCGAEISENSSFCTQCGARVQQTQNMQQDIHLQQSDNLDNEKNEMAKRMLSIASEIEKQQMLDKAKHNPDIQASGQGKIAIKKEHIEAASGWIHRFIECMQSFYKKPVMSIKMLNQSIQELDGILYLFILSAVNSLLNIIDLKVLNLKMGRILSSIEDFVYMYSNTSKYDVVMIGSFGIKYFILDIVGFAVSIGLFILMVIGICKSGIKKDIEWAECVKLMIAPVLILTTAKLALGVVIIISVKLAAVVYLMILFSVGVLVILQYINYIGVSAKAIYLLPILYMISNIIRCWLQYQIGI